MFSADGFKKMFQTDDDWKAFYQMVYDAKLSELNSHKAFENVPGKTEAFFRRMADARYEAEGEAWKAWRRTANYKQFARELEWADASIREYEGWLERKYEDRKLIHSDEETKFEKSRLTANGTKELVNDDICSEVKTA